jgi:hypothetical protein
MYFDQIHPLYYFSLSFYLVSSPFILQFVVGLIMQFSYLHLIYFDDIHAPITLSILSHTSHWFFPQQFSYIFVSYYCFFSLDSAYGRKQCLSS